MNDARRKNIKSILERFDLALLQSLVSDIQDVCDEEQESFDNLPESLQDGDRGQAMQENIDRLQNAIDSLCSAVECVEEAEGQLQEVS